MTAPRWVCRHWKTICCMCCSLRTDCPALQIHRQNKNRLQYAFARIVKKVAPSENCGIWLTTTIAKGAVTRRLLTHTLMCASFLKEHETILYVAHRLFKRPPITFDVKERGRKSTEKQRS